MSLYKSTTTAYIRVRLAVHKDTRECVAVKMVNVVDDSGEGLTQDYLKKEVHSGMHDKYICGLCIMYMYILHVLLADLYHEDVEA